MRKIFYFLSVALFTVGCSADPDSTWTSKMNETWARQADFRQKMHEHNTPTSDWSAEKNSSHEKRWNWFYNWRADYVQQKIESYENLVSFMELDEIPNQKRAGSCDQYLHFYKNGETPESGMKMIYKPDGREGRIAYCYVTKGYNHYKGNEKVGMGELLMPDGTIFAQSHPWSAEAHDCTDVRNFVTGRVFNNMIVDSLYHMKYVNLNESAYTEGAYHVSFNEKDEQVQCDAIENMLVMRKKSGRYRFNRRLGDWEAGFGLLTDDYFLGLRKLHQLTMRDGGKHRYDLMIKMNANWVVNGRRENIAKTRAIYYTDIKFGSSPEYTLTYKSVINPFNIVDAFELYKTNGQPFSHFELNLSRTSDGSRVYDCAAEMNSNWWHNGDNCMRHRPLTNDPGKGRGAAEWVQGQSVIWSEMHIKRIRKPGKWDEWLVPSQKI